MIVSARPRLASWIAENMIRRYKPDGAFSSSLAREGIVTFPIIQLAPGRSVAKKFRAIVELARTSHGPFGACLHLYDASEYERMRLFIDTDAQAGFALNDREVVSVFSHKARQNRHASRTMMALATNLGGTTLNAFDTVLPKLYAKCGFRTVARLPWSDKSAPVGWDFNATVQFNRGRPDVVFMAFGAEVTKVRSVGSFEEGVTAQRLATLSRFEEVSA